MNRRLLTTLLPLTLVVAAGCSTFETDTVATVNGVDLSRDQLDELISVIPAAATPQGGAPVEGDPDNIDDVRQSISVWVRSRVQSDRIEERGLEVSSAAIEDATTGLSGPQGLAGFEEISDESRDLLTAFIAGQQVNAQPATAPSAELLDYYSQGPEESSIICTSHILLADEPTANSVKERLDAGEDFAEIAITESQDPGSGAAGGDLGCQRLDAFTAGFVPEFVAGSLAASIGEPTEPIESDFGFHIILIRTAADSAQGLAAFESDELISLRRAEIDINRRYGTFDPNNGVVVPLG